MSRLQRSWKHQEGKGSYSGFLLTGPAGTAINNPVLYLTGDPVPGGDALAGFDAERAPSPRPLPPQLLSLSASPGVVCVGFL